MSKNRPQRNIARFDYKIYNKTGIKLLKEGHRKGINTMAANIARELKLVCKLDRFKIEYELSLLYEIEDIEEGIKELCSIIDKYDEVHIALKNELRGDTYAESYPDYEARIKSVTDWIKSAKFEIRNKKEEKSLATRLERAEQTEREKIKVIAEEKYFRERIESEIANM